MRAPWLGLFLVLSLSLVACQKKNLLGESKDPELDTPIGRGVLTSAFATRGDTPSGLLGGGNGNYGPNGYFNGNGTNRSNPLENPVAFRLDAFMPNLTNVFESAWPFARRCDAARFAMEKLMVATFVASNPGYIAIRYSMAVGTIVDDTAYLSHLRTVLRTDFGGYTYVPVGFRNTTANGQIGNAAAFYYKLNTLGIRDDASKGKMCFFNAAPIVQGVSGNIPGPGIANSAPGSTRYHTWNYIHYGDRYKVPGEDGYAEENELILSGLKSPRLFAKRTGYEDISQVQFVPVYLVDFREKVFQPGNLSTFSILRPENVGSLPRLHEYHDTGKKIFNLVNVLRHRDRLTQVMATTRTVWAKNNAEVAPNTIGAVQYAYSAYEGAPQIIDNLLYSGVTGTIMSASYTPIVVDLDDKGIITSSPRWGTFFNTGMYQDYSATDPAKKYDIRFQTAWLGGEIESTGLINSVAPHFRPTMKDGFLVLPDVNGQVNDARNLIGQFTPVTVLGVTRTYSDGYQALAALSNKNCSVPSTDPKAYFLGPWDYMYTQIKVWIDRNRNGHSDPGEVISLQEAGIAALNVCNLYKKQERDQYGNDTSKRSAFLYAPDETLNEDEILRRLTTGKTSFGQDAVYRPSVDVRFIGVTENYLQPINPLNVGP